MMMRRLEVLPFVFACACATQGTPLPEVTDPTLYVDPTIGTGGLGFNYGSCFVGAVAPHGLAKVGPDTSSALFGTVNFEHFSGYFGDDDKIRGFSSLHLHGAGATDYGILSVMPTVAFDPSKTRVVDYETPFAKADEHATAGLYQVKLASGIGVELTATPRVAVHRYTLPAGGALVLDLGKTLATGTVDAASIAIDDGTREITGQLHHLGGMSSGFGGYTLYFVARATAPWTQHYTWAAGAAPSAAATAQGKDVGAAIAVGSGTTTLAIGLSLVSVAGARANLAAEAPTLDFDAIAAATRAAWGDKLSVVRLTGGTVAQRRTFYTSLYHAFLMPSVIGDADGTFVLAGHAPQLATGYAQMSDVSGWDVYRTVSPLYSWLAPDDARATAQSLIAFARTTGFFPKWPIAIGEAGTMIGASAEIIIADAVVRGVAVDGADAAYAQLRAAALDTIDPPGGRGGRDRVITYMQHGYIPHGIGASVSMTTEYAHDDFALGQLAGALGHTADRDALVARSHGWRALYDPATTFLRARNADGSFPPATGFDPTAQSDDFDEANAWQSLWMAGLHDPDGLAMILGGNDGAIARLTAMFDATKHDFETADPSAANFPRPYYWAGNEPDLNAVFLFTQLGRADLTQHWLRWLVDTWYSDRPDGVPGNDDGGTMGSWYVLASLGVYPVAGGDTWVLGAPRFPRARVVVGGHELVIEADGATDNAYVRAIELDGVPVTTPTITHAQLAAASKLRFVTSASP